MRTWVRVEPRVIPQKMPSGFASAIPFYRNAPSARIASVRSREPDSGGDFLVVVAHGFPEDFLE